MLDGCYFDDAKINWLLCEIVDADHENRAAIRPQLSASRANQNH
jgi:hypothetical protein